MKVYSVSNVAQVVIRECGEGAALALVAAYGGQHIDIPKTVCGRLLVTLGEDITGVLVEHFGGCQIDVPSRGHVERINKTLLLHHDVQHSTQSANELAAKHGVTNMYVKQLRAKYRAAAASETSRKV